MNDLSSSQKQNIGGLMVLLLFGIFAVCILAVLLSGTSVYDRLTQRDAVAFNARSTVQYLATKIHQAENADAIILEPGEQGDTVLAIWQTYGDERFKTLLYCRDGWLCELFIEADTEVDISTGEQILPAQRIDGSYDNGLLDLSVTDSNGEQWNVHLLLRGGEEHP